MASKFQNRLAGTIILVSLSVILLPTLLDGTKKHHKEQFAAIPLVPQAGDIRDIEMLPPTTSELPSTGTEHTGNPVETDHKQKSTDHSSSPPVGNPASPTEQDKHQPEILSPRTTEADNSHSLVAENPRMAEVEPPHSPAAKNPQTADKPQPSDTESSQPTKPAPPADHLPVGRAYVVQLGALKNADKVNEIIATLRLSGYQVYTIPSKPTTSGITRIYVGPDISKQKLQSQLAELHQLSGLKGQVKDYQP